MTERRSDSARRPAAFRIDEPQPDKREETPPGEATIHTPRKPVQVPASVTIVPDEEDPFLSPTLPETVTAEADALTPPPALPRPRRFSFAKLAAGAFGIVASIAIGLWIDELIRALFERAPWLAWTTLALVGIGVAALLVALLREVIAIYRLGAIQNVKQEVEQAWKERRPERARTATSAVAGLLAARPETAKGRATLADLEGEIVDGPALVELAETELLSPLDRQARRLILDASKRVSIVTAVSPRALVDLAYVAYEATRLVRSMATLYGGRPGTFGMLRLMRDVIAHLAVTGSIAVGDSLIQQVVGHGVAARLSSRLGEGVINGLMTARIGIAAMDLCRPMPFRALRRPRMGDFLGDLTKLAGSAGRGNDRTS